MDSSHDAVVYDLDGTLVKLAVDWGVVRRAVLGVYRSADVDPGDGSLWSLVERAEESGLSEAVEETITEFERAGARESARLPLADELPQSVPVGVCSLNSEEACRIALETHGLSEHVDAVVGRDSVAEQKPDPGPLLSVLEELGVDPSRALFVGDSETDAEAAAAAGTDFQYVRDR